MDIISGKTISQDIKEELKLETQKLKQKGIEPCLAVILVGDDPASKIYVNSKKKTCEDLGFRSLSHHLPASVSQEELERLILALNQDPSVHGILCQMPLPKPLDEDRVIKVIDPDKDVDGLSPVNLGLLACGKPRFISCTPYGVLQLLRRSEVPTEGKHAVIIGRSNLVGRPLSLLLGLKSVNCTVTVCHSRTQNLVDIASTADILVAAIGRPEFVTVDMVKPGAVVIDVGINRIDDASREQGYRLCGDVAYDTVAHKSSKITPVPGGVGPMTIAMLMLNTINAARWQNGLETFPI